MTQGVGGLLLARALPRAVARTHGKRCAKLFYSTSWSASPNARDFAERNIMEDLPGLPDQSALTPANFTTLPHFSVSWAMSLPKSAGEPGSAVAPHSASRAFILGSASAALISVLSLSTISAGVLRGAPMPVQKLNS